ncbi:MAG: ABC transporter ATP-binding protein [Candidatus Magasanikbacteria bacterium]|nr:ABC transporter ATP-binding protein [Candidatus Magasanikbacteria bacterium]
MKQRTKQTLQLYWSQMRNYKFLLFFMLLALGIATVLEIIIPIFYKQFFDILTSAQPSSTIATALMNTLFMILAINAISWIIYRFTTFTSDYFQPHVSADLLQYAYKYLQRHSYNFFTNRFVGSLVRKVTKLSRAFQTFADRTYWHLFTLAIRIIGATIVLYLFNHTVAYILFVWTIIFIAINYFFSVWKLKYDTARSAKDTETVAVLADAVTNQVNIQLFNGFTFEFGRFKKVTDELQKLQTLTWNLGSIIEGIQAALFIAVEFLLMYFAIKFWQQGNLTVGDFVLIQSYLLSLINRLWDVGRHIRDIYESFADAEEITEILNTPHEIIDAPNAKTLVVKKGEIKFKKVNFSFHQTRRVLQDINLVIKSGEKIALIGPSGAGKTMLMKALFRFHDIDNGDILIDGQSIKKINQESLHDNLSLVPQDPILFHRSLMENIRYGQRKATDKEVLAAAKLAHCDDFIINLPQKYATFVGERGIKLSGGERQRVAIARAILKNSPILVLDEATSSLDSHSEAMIQDALAMLMKNKTVVVIAHRLSTIRQMDRVVVIKNGRIFEQGTHDELLAKDSLYKHLWQIQAGGFLPEEER